MPAMTLKVPANWMQKLGLPKAEKNDSASSSDEEMDEGDNTSVFFFSASPESKTFLHKCDEMKKLFCFIIGRTFCMVLRMVLCVGFVSPRDAVKN